MLSVLLLASFFSRVLAQVLSLRSPDTPSNALTQHAHYAPPQPDSDLLDDLDLLDIVLLASVDGKFHALNRSDGHFLWSMGPFAPSGPFASVSPESTSGPTALSPLVRTHHIDHDPEVTDDSAQQEVYIIEPQSGDIYVMPNPSSPLQRFPFSMQELVDLSPYSFMGEEDKRVFVGKKETSLLVVELETGKIKATLNSECPWYQFEEFRDNSELDLDELDGSKPPKTPPTEIYIGRTDYQVSIITRSSTAASTVQNLSFSTYGPNRQDSHLQTLYRRTKDGAYVQSLPNGEVLSFKAKSPPEKVVPSPNHLLWGQRFNQPIVAVFDILRHKSSSSQLDSRSDPQLHPFVLLQPRPEIQDILPNISPTLKENPSAAYVGLIPDSNSLFAMSPQRYPLVAFSRKSDMRHKGNRRMIDSGSHSGSGFDIDVGVEGEGRKKRKKVKVTEGEEVVIEEEEEEPTSVDDITYQRKLREAARGTDEDQLQCHDKIMNDRRCLIGIRRLDLNIGDGRETRMKRLLDAPSPSHSPYGDHQQPYEYDPARSTYGNNESKKPLPPLTIDPPVPSDPPVVPTANGWGLWVNTLAAIVILGLVSFWVVSRQETWRKSLGVGSKRIQPANNQVEVVKEGVVSPPSAQDDTKVESKAHTEDPESAPSSQSITPPTSIDTSSSPISVPSTPSTAVPIPIPSTPTPDTPVLTGDETDKEDLDGDGELDEESGAVIVQAADAAATPKKRTRRGRRGAKKPKNASGNSSGEAKANTGGKGKEKDSEKEKEKEKEETPVPQPQSSLIVTSAAMPVMAPSPSLNVSDTVLGYGSHGTVVYRGSLQGRAVAVKRLLADFVTLASREVSILQESDDHPNVIRYYYQEAHAGFLYIALELCPASLADLIETPDRDAWRDIAVSFDPKRALRQVTNGLRHLHGLKLVHRDIKPQNILVSTKGAGTSSGSLSSASAGASRGGNYRMLISDFGLCKKLDVDQTSFLPTAHGAMAAGTVGWRAPEILRGEVKLDEGLSDEQSMSSRGSAATINGNASISSTSSSNSNSGKGRTRLTKSVDIFALGCLYYYTLTSGGHPFGDRYEREVNIIKNEKNLELLERYGEEGTEAVDLIERMLDPLPSERPDTTSCLLHPFFWDSSRRLNFLQDASDRFEIMCRDPKDPHLLTLEEGAQEIVGHDWHARLDKVFIDNLGKFRKYDGRSVQDLLRALRNKKHHYQDIPDNVKRHLGPMPEGFLAYFTRRFPKLFLHVHRVVKETGLAGESMFRSYFELPDS